LKGQWGTSKAIQFTGAAKIIYFENGCQNNQYISKKLAFVTTMRLDCEARVIKHAMNALVKFTF